MDIGNYSLEILSANRIRRNEHHGDGYVPMAHGEYFMIRMRNRSGRRTMADVTVNGQDCGTFVMRRYETTTIERPVHAEYKFQFYRVGSQEAQGAALWAGDNANGLVQVTFRPEVEREVVTRYTKSGPGGQSLRGAAKGLDMGMDESLTMGMPSASSYDEGGIGLGEHSDQHFQQVSGFKTDPGGTVTISLRLVCKKDRDDRPKPIRGPMANPVPPPVG